MNVYYKHVCKRYIIGRKLLEAVMLPVNKVCLDGFYFIPRKMPWVRWKIKGYSIIIWLGWLYILCNQECLFPQILILVQVKIWQQICILLLLNIKTHEKPTPSAAVVTGDIMIYYIIFDSPKGSHEYCAFH